MSKDVIVHDVRRCDDDVLLLRHHLPADWDFSWGFAPDTDPGVGYYEVWYQHVPPPSPQPRVGLMRFGR